MTVKMTADRLAKVLDAMRQLMGQQVLVGIPADYGERRPTRGPKGKTTPSHINNAALGYIHEFGAPEANIPARPWLVPGVSNVREEVADVLEAAARRTLDGRLGVVTNAFHSVGAMARDSVKAKITSGPFVPLAEATIKGRLRRRRSWSLKKRQRMYENLMPGDMRPLIDTGQLRQAINYVIRET